MPPRKSPTLNFWVVKKRTRNNDSSPELGDPPPPGAQTSAAPEKPPKKRTKAETKKGEAEKKKGSRAPKLKAPKEPTKEELWNAKIKGRGEWVVDKKYKCPYSSITKTEALKYIRKCEPKLTQRELLTLAFETRRNLKDKDYTPSHQYCVVHINNLVHEKAKALGVTAKMPMPSDPPSPPPLAGPSNEQSNTVDPPLAPESTTPDKTPQSEPLP